MVIQSGVPESRSYGVGLVLGPTDVLFLQPSFFSLFGPSTSRDSSTPLWSRVPEGSNTTSRDGQNHRYFETYSLSSSCPGSVLEGRVPCCAVHLSCLGACGSCPCPSARGPTWSSRSLSPPLSSFFRKSSPPLPGTLRLWSVCAAAGHRFQLCLHVPDPTPYLRK